MFFLLHLIKQKLSSYVQLVVQDCLQSVSGQTWIRVTESSTTATTMGMIAMHIFIPVNVFVVDTYPAWIVGLRGLWPSTKIWLSPPETTTSPFGCEYKENKNGLNWPKKNGKPWEEDYLEKDGYACWGSHHPVLRDAHPSLDLFFFSVSFFREGLLSFFSFFSFCLYSVAFFFISRLPFTQKIIIAFWFLFHLFFIIPLSSPILSSWLF